MIAVIERPMVVYGCVRCGEPLVETNVPVPSDARRLCKSCRRSVGVEVGP